MNSKYYYRIVTIISFIILSLSAIWVVKYRMQHPELTETQLLLEVWPLSVCNILFVIVFLITKKEWK